MTKSKALSQKELITVIEDLERIMSRVLGWCEAKEGLSSADVINALGVALKDIRLLRNRKYTKLPPSQGAREKS